MCFRLCPFRTIQVVKMKNGNLFFVVGVIFLGVALLITVFTPIHAVETWYVGNGTYETKYFIHVLNWFFVRAFFAGTGVMTILTGLVIKTLYRCWPIE